MQAVITVVGQDKVGILAKVSTVCAQAGANIEEVTQSILRGTFAMIMIAEMPEGGNEYHDLAQQLREAGEELGVDVHVTRQELYDAMHRI